MNEVLPILHIYKRLNQKSFYVPNYNKLARLRQIKERTCFHYG
nr:MAG TPA: hypothetical protein [Caudoviricetes sp.]